MIARLDRVDEEDAPAEHRHESEDDQHKERMRREGNRLVHEEISKTGGPSKYTVVLAERFVVSAEGEGVDIEVLRKAVASIDLAKLEALK